MVLLFTAMVRCTTDDDHSTGYSNGKNITPLSIKNSCDKRDEKESKNSCQNTFHKRKLRIVKNLKIRCPFFCIKKGI